MMKTVFVGELLNKLTLKECLFLNNIEQKYFSGQFVSIEEREKRKEILKKIDK